MLPSRNFGESMAGRSAGFVKWHIQFRSLRLISFTEALGAALILISALLACLALVTKGVDAGLVGLVLSYGLNTTGSLVCYPPCFFLKYGYT